MNAFKRTALIALVALAAVAMAQDKATLRLNVKPGMTLAQTTVSDGTFSISGPTDQEMKNKTTMVQTFKFEEGTEGWVKFGVETTDFKMEGDSMDMGGGTDPDQIAAMAKKVKLTGEVNDRGATRNVAISGADDLDMTSKQMMTSVADRMSQIGFMEMFFPDEAISVGSTWKRELDLAKTLSSIPFFQNVKGTAPVEFTVEAFEKVGDKDTVKIKVFTDGKVTFELSMGGGGDGNMSLTSNGEVWVDLATGLPIKSTGKMANDIDFGMGHMQQQMTITSKIDFKS